MSSSTPWSLSVLTLSVRSVLPSILSKISALQISDFSLLNRSAHTLRYRRFASILTDANARLAVEVVVSLLPPVGLSPTTLRQLAWRTDSCRLYLSLTAIQTFNDKWCSLSTTMVNSGSRFGYEPASEIKSHGHGRFPSRLNGI